MFRFLFEIKTSTKALFCIFILFLINFCLINSVFALESNYSSGKMSGIDFKKQFELNYINYNHLKNLGDYYCDKEDFKNAVRYYQQAIIINKNEADLNKLGLIYFINNNYYDSLKCFEESLKINPKNELTEKKIHYVKYKISRKEKDDNYTQKSPKQTAPEYIHALVKTDGKINDEKDLDKLHKIIDFIWSDNQGKILLKTVANGGLQIYLKQNIAHSCFMASRINQNYAYIPYHPELSNLVAYNINVSKKIYIKEKAISKFQESDTNWFENECAIMVVTHELCHMIKYMHYPTSTDSREEELIAYMFGLDLASKALTDTPLTEDKTIEYATIIYNSVFDRNYHNIVSKDDSAYKLKKLGFELPYYYLYQNMDELELDTQKDDSEVINYLKTFNQNISKDFQSVFVSKPIYSFYDLYINKNGDIIFIKKTKDSKFIDMENLFNIAMIAYSVPFPQNYKRVLISLTFYRHNKSIKIK